MKKTSWTRAAAIGFIVALGCASGARTVRLSTSSTIPAAQGTVKASKTDNDNTMLELEVRHLASPERVAPEATTYVVWVLAVGQFTPQNLGALMVDKDLRGTLKTVTPLRSFDVFITAESSPTTMSPTNGRLFSGSVRR